MRRAAFVWNEHCPRFLLLKQLARDIREVCVLPFYLAHDEGEEPAEGREVLFRHIVEVA